MKGVKPRGDGVSILFLGISGELGKRFLKLRSESFGEGRTFSVCNTDGVKVE